MRVVLAGFGPFPGVPFNPSAVLVGELARRRRPALADIICSTHVFATSYAAVDRDLPKLFAEKPDLFLIFGVAGRRRYLSVETRARNALSVLYPDASGPAPRAGQLSAAKPARCAAQRLSCDCWARCDRAAFRRDYRAMPDVICATMPIGVRWREHARRRRSFSSSTFPLSNCQRADAGRATKY